MTWGSWALVGMLALPGAAAAAEKETGFGQAVGPYFETHCVRCHGEKRQRGDFRLEEVSRDFGNSAAAGRWADVMDKISSGEMPPEDEDVLPTADENLDVVAWLADRLKEGEASRLSKRDPVSFHRLTREEYVNTVENLLGVRYDATDPGGLTEDPDWNGFERIGSVLSLSASHVKKISPQRKRLWRKRSRKRSRSRSSCGKAPSTCAADRTRTRSSGSRPKGWTKKCGWICGPVT